MIRDVESAIFLTPAPLFLIVCLLFLGSKSWIRWRLLSPIAKIAKQPSDTRLDRSSLPLR